MATYKVSESNEAPELSKIEVSGFTNVITLNDTLESIRKNAKGILEIESNIRLKKALKENVLNNHPGIQYLTPELRVAKRIPRCTSNFVTRSRRHQRTNWNRKEGN